MKRIVPIAAVCLSLTAADWPTQSGSPQRDGWAKSETAFTRENAKGLELLYKFKAENQSRGPDSLTTPLINTRIITYLGFKEELVFGGSSDNVFAVDADLNRIIWKTHFDYKGDRPQAAATALCPGGMTSSVVMNGSSTAATGRGMGGGAPAPGGRAGAIGRGQVIPPGRMGGPGAGQPRGGNRSGEYFAIGGDGYLHTLNTSTGQDRAAPRKFLPANAKAGAMNVFDNTIYVATLDNCGGNPDTLYALDLSPEGNEGKVASIPLNTAGVAIGADGTIYAQAEKSVLALAPKTLDVMSRFEGPAGGSAMPVVFTWREKDVVLSGTSDGRLFLLDSSAMATPLAQTEPQSEGFQGGFASWTDATGARWIYATTATHIIGYRLDEQAGKPVLTQVWKSKEIKAPAPPVTANGLVFALATEGRAVLSLLDGATGTELYNSGTLATTSAHNSGLAVANKRIYFTTRDNNVYCFGFFADQPQLTGR